MMSVRIQKGWLEELIVQTPAFLIDSPGEINGDAEMEGN